MASLKDIVLLVVGLVLGVVLGVGIYWWPLGQFCNEWRAIYNLKWTRYQRGDDVTVLAGTDLRAVDTKLQFLAVWNKRNCFTTGVTKLRKVIQVFAIGCAILSQGCTTAATRDDSESAQGKLNQFNAEMQDPQIRAYAESFDAAKGPGAFRNAVADRGQLASFRGVDLSVAQAIQEVRAQYGTFAERQGAAVSQKLRLGMTKDEVQALLGDPERFVQVKGGQMWFYRTGYAKAPNGEFICATVSAGIALEYSECGVFFSYTGKVVAQFGIKAKFLDATEQWPYDKD